MSPSIFFWTHKQTNIASDLKKTMLVKPQQAEATIEEGKSAQTPKKIKEKEHPLSKKTAILKVEVESQKTVFKTQ